MGFNEAGSIKNCTHFGNPTKDHLLKKGFAVFCTVLL